MVMNKDFADLDRADWPLSVMRRRTNACFSGRRNCSICFWSAVLYHKPSMIKASMI
jgi:hypothetical protein